MKVRIEVDGSIMEEEVVIRCCRLNEEVQQLERLLSDRAAGQQTMVFYKGDTEYYLSLEEILFFETEEKVIFAHSAKETYRVKYRLYELEEVLPGHFMRVSKSTVLNTQKIYSIQRNLAASSIVSFQNTHKQVYVSRHYYKPLKNKLEEKRNWL